MFRNVVFTLNNPEDMIMFDEDKMEYLVYQEEIGEGGNYHFQGYCEFKNRTRLNAAKELLGGARVHLEGRRGSAEQAAAYAKKEDTRVAHTEPYEWGAPRQQGKRVDLEDFAERICAGDRMIDLVEDHLQTLARFSKLYWTLKLLTRPVRTKELVVTLLYGDTGLGKTRSIEEKYGGDTDFWRCPLNNGTMWFDGYDGHKRVLLDDFSGAASHFTLCNLLQLLDRYPLLVPTKGGHTWWMPDEVFVTTNLMPKDWYKWENRGKQYVALARRFHAVREYHVSLPNTHSSYTMAEPEWWKENAPDEAVLLEFEFERRQGVLTP